MPKYTVNIHDISEGLNSDSDPKMISENSVHDLENVNIDRIGRIKPTSGYSVKGNISINNYLSGLYCFRTDDGGNNPAEYILAQNGTTVQRLNPSNLSVLGSFTAPNPAGFNYSNGVLLTYPKSPGTNPFAMLAGGWSDSDKYTLDYNNQKASIGINLGYFEQSLTFHSGDPNADVFFDIEVYETETQEEQAKVYLDFTMRTLDEGATIQILYQNEEHLISIQPSPTPEQFGNNIESIINASESIPITASFNSTTLIMELMSEYPGEEGNGDILFFRMAGGVPVTMIFGGTFFSGKNADFEDGGNIDKVIPSGRYTFAASLLLWDGSETSVSEQSASVIFDQKTKISIRVNVDNFSGFSDFVKGLKFYIASESFEFSLLGEYRPSSTRRFRFYNENEFSTNSTLSHKFDLTLPMRSTFRFEAGYDPDKPATPFFRKFLIINNRGFAFNIAYNGEHHQDRIIISPQGKPYVLPEENKIEIVTEDGDEYVTAEHFGQLLYCFKKYTLYIMNIGSNDPSSFFLQDSIYGVGVESEPQVTKTDVGIFWANKHGIYHHSGEGLPTNICYNRIEDEWKLINSDVIRCGYDQIAKKVVFTRGDITYVFDIKLSSFSKLTGIGSGNKSAYINNLERLSIAVESQMKDFSLSNGASNWFLTTKDYDLGDPSVRKKVRRFYVKFGSPNVVLNNVSLEYKIDGTGGWTEITNKQFVNNEDNVVKNTVAMFDLPRSITAYSIQLKISGTISQEVRDISIVYRPKHPK